MWLQFTFAFYKVLSHHAGAIAGGTRSAARFESPTNLDCHIRFLFTFTFAAEPSLSETLFQCHYQCNAV